MDAVIVKSIFIVELLFLVHEHLLVGDHAKPLVDHHLELEDWDCFCNCKCVSLSQQPGLHVDGEEVVTEVVVRHSMVIRGEAVLEWIVLILGLACLNLF